MKKAKPKIEWIEVNRLFLAAEFARLRVRLGQADARTKQVPAKALAMEAPAAIDHLTNLFGLSPFERDILLLTAGIEMESSLAAQCGGPVTFGLAMAKLAEPHWDALTPLRPLRRFRLIELERGHSLTSAHLRIDEQILHYLAGIRQPDPRLQPWLTTSPFPTWIAEEHKAIAAQAVRILETVPDPPPLLHLCGDDSQGQEDVAALAASQIGRQLFCLRAEDLPAIGADLDQFALLWEREALLLSEALLICNENAGFSASARRLAERLPGVVMLASREAVHLNRPFFRLEVDKPAPAGQKRLWQVALGPASANFNGALDSVSQQFRLSAHAIHSTSRLVTPQNAGHSVADPAKEHAELWNMCRSQSRPRLEHLAQRITASAGWDDLVLPDPQMQTLRHLVAQVQNRMRVYETWGFSAKGRRGLGVSALFTGESGTGKTLAAEVLAHELALDLYRIDLSAVVSKYIGETEKNLRQVFDAAEEGGSLLLFDEADALFGKRSDVKDSNSHYANIEVGYLLQRMEAYQGLAILTTNLKSNIDLAFQRRLRFTVNFTFPDAMQRQSIWKRAFPSGVPVQDLDTAKLASFKGTGGNIRNIALNAAFFAAAGGSAVGMKHILDATSLEAQKLERPLSEVEVRGWAK